MRIGCIFLLIVGCGEPHSEPQVVADFSKEKVELIFARKTDNKQFCFYANNVDAELVFAGDGQTADNHTDNELLPTKSTNTPKVDYSKIAEGSTLLTERSVSSKDLFRPLVGNSKWHNIYAKSSQRPYYHLLSIPCLATTIFVPNPVLSLSCIPFVIYAITPSVIRGYARKKVLAEGHGKLQASLSSSIHDNPLLLSELRKIFRWLESENSVACPTQPRIEQ